MCLLHRLCIFQLYLEFVWRNSIFLFKSLLIYDSRSILKCSHGTFVTFIQENGVQSIYVIITVCSCYTLCLSLVNKILNLELERTSYYNWHCKLILNQEDNTQKYRIVKNMKKLHSFFLLVCLMVFNATFNNISVMSWRSVLLVKETRGPGENHRPVTSQWQTLSHDVVHLFCFVLFCKPKTQHKASIVYRYIQYISYLKIIILAF